MDPVKRIAYILKDALVGHEQIVFYLFDTIHNSDQVDSLNH